MGLHEKALELQTIADAKGIRAEALKGVRYEVLEVMEAVLAKRPPQDVRGRAWLHTEVRPYNGQSYKMDFWALEGTPVRGFVVMSSNFIKGFDSQGKCVKTLKNFDGAHFE